MTRPLEQIRREAEASAYTAGRMMARGEVDRATIRDQVAKHAELARRSGEELNRRIEGLGLLFGPELAESLRRAAEGLWENADEIRYWHEQAEELHDRDTAAASTLAWQRIRRAETKAEALRVVLAGAVDDFAARAKRNPQAKVPAWVTEALPILARIAAEERVAGETGAEASDGPF